jgi:hypothetical protein
MAEDRPNEARLEDLVEDAAEGLWLRFRDVVLVSKKLEEFVF